MLAGPGRCHSADPCCFINSALRAVNVAIQSWMQERAGELKPVEPVVEPVEPVELCVF